MVAAPPIKRNLRAAASRTTSVKHGRRPSKHGRPLDQEVPATNATSSGRGSRLQKTVKKSARRSRPAATSSPTSAEKTSAKSSAPQKWEKNSEATQESSKTPAGKIPVKTSVEQESVKTADAQGSVKTSAAQKSGKSSAAPKKDAPTECPTCGKSYVSFGSFRIHMRSKHGQGKPAPYSCVLCEREFYHLDNFQSHMNKHAGMKPHECPHCDATYTSRKGLSTHMATHLAVHEGKPPAFACKVCRKVFAKQQYLRDHEQSHSVESQYSCSGCHRAYKYRSSLLYHKKHCQVGLGKPDIDLKSASGNGVSGNEEQSDVEQQEIPTEGQT